LKITMPTFESAAALAKLVAARERLTEISKQLTEANSQVNSSSAGRQRYEELQKAWDQAFHDFKAAAQAFASIAQALPDNPDPRVMLSLDVA
jgi:hypothetical protein